jgi:hypothetical protein
MSTENVLMIQKVVFYFYIFERINKYFKNKKKSVAFSPQANYTDWATAACRRS